MLKGFSISMLATFFLSGCAVTVDRASSTPVHDNKGLDQEQVAYLEYQATATAGESDNEIFAVFVTSIDGKPVPKDASYLEVMPGARQVQMSCHKFKEFRGGSRIDIPYAEAQSIGALVVFDAGEVVTIKPHSFENNFCSVTLEPRRVETKLTRPDL